MDLFTDVELLIMAGVVGVLLLIVIILSISEILSRKKEKNILLEENLEEETDNSLYNTLIEFNKIEDKPLNLEEVKPFQEVEVLENKTEEIQVQTIKTKEKSEEDNLIFEEVTEIEPLILELDPVVNIVKVESEELKELDSREKAQIELLKVEEQLEHVTSLEDTITNLEALEEENAIISYQELLNTGELDVVACDDGDEPITIDEVFKMFNDQNDEGFKITEALENIPLSEAYQGDFMSTPYLSPISGIENESLSEIQLENTANLEKLEKEIRKTNEFLNILNELKKNLE